MGENAVKRVGGHASRGTVTPDAALPPNDHAVEKVAIGNCDDLNMCAVQTCQHLREMHSQPARAMRRCPSLEDEGKRLDEAMIGRDTSNGLPQIRVGARGQNEHEHQWL